MTKLTTAEIQILKEKTPISQIIGQVVTFDKKKSNPRKQDWWGCCPFHGEKSPSFHCDDHKGMYHCFGCGASGDHIAFLQEINGLTFAQAIEALGGDVRVEYSEEQKREYGRRQREMEQAKQKDKEQAVEKAEDIWSASKFINDSPAEVYLTERGIENLPRLTDIRFNPNMYLKGYSDVCGLVCKVTSPEGKLTSVWRIFLNKDGSPVLDDRGKKFKLGRGPIEGGSIRLFRATDELCVAEGVETSFGVWEMLGRKKPVWSVMSTSGMQAFKVPDRIKTLHIYADGDSYRFDENKNVVMPPGRRAAEALYKAAQMEGRKIYIHYPPEGSDWLDVWNTMKELL